MPIVYEPPQPFSPAISQGYGAAMQQVQDLPLIQHAQDQLQANRRAEFQGQLQNNALAAQAGQANADRAAAEAARSAGMRESAYQFDQSRTPSARDQFFADQQAQQEQQRFALHAQMQQQELSQAETMRLQRLQQAKGTIQQQVDEGQLTAAEGNALMTQAQTGINPLMQRQAAAKVSLEQAQAQHEMDLHARAMIQENEAKKFYAKTFSERVAAWTDPETGRPIHFYEKAPGQWEPVKSPEVAQEKQAKEAANLDAIRLKDYSTQVQRIERANEQWAERRDKKDEAMAPKNGRAPEPMTPEQIHANFLDDLKKAGLEPTWEAQRAKMMGQEAAKQPVTVTGSGQIPTPAVPPDQQQPPASPKPFDWNERQSQTPAQAALVRQFGIDRRQVEQDGDVSDFRKQQVLSAMDVAKAILEKTGGVAPPPGDPRRQQLDALNAFIQANKPRKAPPAAPAGPRPDLYRPAPAWGGY